MVVQRGIAGPEPSNGLLPAGTPWGAQAGGESPDGPPDGPACDPAALVVVDAATSPLDGALRLLGMAVVVGGLVLAWHLIDGRERDGGDDGDDEFEEFYPAMGDDFDFDDEDGDEGGLT